MMRCGARGEKRVAISQRNFAGQLLPALALAGLRAQLPAATLRRFAGAGFQACSAAAPAAAGAGPARCSASTVARVPRSFTR
jgi:hypothetical protein